MEAGLSLTTGLPQPRQCSLAARAKSSFRWSFSSVIVPTVQREVRKGLVWSMAIAGGMPSTASTCGLSLWATDSRAYQQKESAQARWPTACNAQKTSDDAPHAERPGEHNQSPGRTTL